MSAIDTYWHEVIGQIDGIPIYRLKENGPKKTDGCGFTGKKGDVLLGGGSGESSALIIRIPEAIKWFTNKNEYMMQKEFSQIITTYWSNNDAYEFIKKYKEIGYNNNCGPIEIWLSENIVAWLIKTFIEYSKHIGDLNHLIVTGDIVTDPDSQWVEFNKEWFERRDK